MALKDSSLPVRCPRPSMRGEGGGDIGVLLETTKPKKESSKTAKWQKIWPKPKTADKTVKNRYNGDE